MRFFDVTQASGITDTGSSYGSAWGDFDDDGYVDLWVSNHGSRPTLYRNQGDSTFVDVVADVFETQPQGDFHGASWSDFDHDGDLDLLQLVGGDSGTGSLENPAHANRLYINQNNTFSDRATEWGLDYTGSSARTPLWFDYNLDGNLDLLHSAATRSDGEVPGTIFVREGDNFVDLGSRVDFDFSGTEFAILSDLVGDRHPEIIVNQPKSGISIYDSTDLVDITDALLSGDYQGTDAIAGDFNGDLLPDLYLTRRGLSNSALVTPDEGTLNFRLEANQNQQGVTFQTESAITIDLFTFGFAFEEIDPEDIFIGASGLNPDDLGLSSGTPDTTITELEFTLNPQHPLIEGIAEFVPGEDEGLYIGYDSEAREWQIFLSTPDQDLVAGVVTAETSIEDIEAIAFNNDLEPAEDRLLINDGSKLIDLTTDSGINGIRTAGVSAVAGDFDNDMDLDIYVVTANSAGNEPNVFYDNQGDGTFVAITDPLYESSGNLGIGESVSTTDYNNDGFFDLLVTNGGFPPILTENAPYQLLENQGNDHHWLEIDLEGTVSNRDGIGAKVYLTAGGVTQLREQSGGIHNRVQNDSRLHFGLADNTTVESITVEWASGTIQTIEDVSVDRIIEITECVDC